MAGLRLENPQPEGPQRDVLQPENPQRDGLRPQNPQPEGPQRDGLQPENPPQGGPQRDGLQPENPQQGGPQLGGLRPENPTEKVRHFVPKAVDPAPDADLQNRSLRPREKWPTPMARCDSTDTSPMQAFAPGERRMCSLKAAP